MSHERCPHCDRELSAQAIMYCPHCGERLDQSPEIRDRSERLRDIPRSRDEPTSNWGLSKWGLLLGIGYGIYTSINRAQGMKMESAEMTGYIVGGAIGGGLLGYFFGWLLDKMF